MASTPFKLTAANSTNLTKLKDIGSGVLKSVDAINTTAAAVFLKFYWFPFNASAAAPTVGTTVPDLTIEIPALGTTTGNVNRDWSAGLSKAGVLWFAITNLVADSDNTAVAAGSAIVTIGFE